MRPVSWGKNIGTKKKPFTYIHICTGLYMHSEHLMILVPLFPLLAPHRRFDFQFDMFDQELRGLHMSESVDDNARGEDKADPESYRREAMEYASNPEKDDVDNAEACPRATAEEKEVAEFVHKAHLLCLLGRGRLIDSACNDPLIQASILSLIPTHLHKIAEAPNLTASHLSPLVSWFHNNFHVRSPNVAEKSCHFALASTLETREGSPEAVAALSVALFRALNLTTRLPSWDVYPGFKDCVMQTAIANGNFWEWFRQLLSNSLIFRFVSILDVISLKPDADKSESSVADGCKNERDIFSSSTLMVAGPSCSSAYTVKPSPYVEQDSSQTAIRGAGRQKADKSRKHELQSQDSLITDKPTDKMSEVSVSEVPTDTSEPCLVKSEGLKRKGDLEFQMQLEMALSATAVVNSHVSMASDASESPSTSTLTPPSKRMKKIRKEESQTCSNGISTAIGSKKVGAPLYWAEVFCGGENLTGKWVHVDAVNAIIDGEHKVEAAAAACKKSLRYVVAFAGHGAKDVTRRYCTKWYKVAAQRINSTWWDAVLEPLKELESGATGGVVSVECEASCQKKVEVSQVEPSMSNSCGASMDSCEKKATESFMRNSFASTRGSLEDMELETRALIEPLPTNQQAYRNHHLYVIERWLKKYEILYPKGPVLGFCSGHSVYPRTCVQTLHTKERWLREGLQVKAGEVPVKVLKRSMKCSKEEAGDDNDYAEVDHQGITSLYGKWQTEPLCLPRAVNGIVPKNERGQVDVWSEKCLPPGTIHLRLPRVATVARRLDIDFAPAMVGFDFRNGRSVPLFEGIVVCTEFKDAILEAYFEEEERREAEEKRKNEAQALSRWYQLLSSIITRKRLNECYGDGALPQSSIEIPKSGDKCYNSSATATATQKTEASPECQQVNIPEKLNAPSSMPTENHEHEFILDEKKVDEGGLTRIKRCHCGFSIQFEEL
ncbi:hypothetical protein DH2020_040370 [Rehmannia glutinosa]|uniref:DNA repair protein n=1 Tax=Rehmannia glutinosa TaxID=99300 RepID=A0ABR0UTB6_REHGL